MLKSIIVSLCVLSYAIGSDTPAQEYRSLNGTGNNMANPIWGSNNQHFLHPLSEYFYDDNVSIPRGGYPPSNKLPEERTVRNEVLYGQGIPFQTAASDWYVKKNITKKIAIVFKICTTSR